MGNTKYKLSVGDTLITVRYTSAIINKGDGWGYDKGAFESVITDIDDERVLVKHPKGIKFCVKTFDREALETVGASYYFGSAAFVKDAFHNDEKITLKTQLLGVKYNVAIRISELRELNPRVIEKLVKRSAFKSLPMENSAAYQISKITTLEDVDYASDKCVVYDLANQEATRNVLISKADALFNIDLDSLYKKGFWVADKENMRNKQGYLVRSNNIIMAESFYEAHNTRVKVALRVFGHENSTSFIEQVETSPIEFSQFELIAFKDSANYFDRKIREMIDQSNEPVELLNYGELITE